MKEPARLVRRRFAEVVADYFATMVYLTCGKLDLKAVTTSPSVRVFCKLARTRTSSQLV